MAKLIVTEYVTLDGVMEAPGGEPGHPHTGWAFDFVGPEHDEFKLRETLDAGSHLLGRVTYESFAEAWPSREGEFADKVNSMPKHVVSTTMTQGDLEWENCHLIGEDVPAAIAELKQADGGPILVAGSRTLVHSLFEHDLIDELRLMVFPVVLGSGGRVFPESPETRTLKLVDVRTFDTGVAVNTYEPA